jgi:sRNA-binding carbon storage regulator CsrA
MLVLSRKTDEKIVLRDRTTGQIIGEVVLVEIRRGCKVRLGFAGFSDDVEILRGELDGKRKRAGVNEAV